MVGLGDVVSQDQTLDVQSYDLTQIPQEKLLAIRKVLGAQIADMAHQISYRKGDSDVGWLGKARARLRVLERDHRAVKAELSRRASGAEAAAAEAQLVEELAPYKRDAKATG